MPSLSQQSLRLSLTRHQLIFEKIFIFRHIIANVLSFDFRRSFKPRTCGSLMQLCHIAVTLPEYGRLSIKRILLLDNSIYLPPKTDAGAIMQSPRYQIEDCKRTFGFLPDRGRMPSLQNIFSTNSSISCSDTLPNMPFLLTQSLM